MSSLQILEARIKDELENLNKLLSEAESIREKKASNINVRAGGSILHDFYTGIERIFESIAGTIDMKVPIGMNWHIELLNQMTLKIPDLRTHMIMITELIHRTKAKCSLALVFNTCSTQCMKSRMHGTFKL